MSQPLDVKMIDPDTGTTRKKNYSIPYLGIMVKTPYSDPYRLEVQSTSRHEVTESDLAGEEISF
jgi:hypothetical protein